MEVKELTNQEFDDFINFFEKKSIYQTKEYAFVMNEQNYDSLLLGMKDKHDNIIAASLVLVEKKYGFKYAYAPRGFLLDYTNGQVLKEFSRQIRKYLKKLDVIAIKINPIIYKQITDSNGNIIDKNSEFDNIMIKLKKNKYYHLGFNNSFEALKPRFEAIIKIDKDYVNMFNKLPKNIKTKVRSAEKNGIVIHKGNQSNLAYLYDETKKKYPRDLKYFEDCYNFFNQNKKAEFYYAKLDTRIFLDKVRKEFQKHDEVFSKINDEFLKNKNDKLIMKKMIADEQVNISKNSLIEATKLSHEYPNGIVIAGIIVIRHANTATLLIDGYDPKFKKYNGKHLLIWKLIELFSKQGITEFNLGGINNPSNPDEKYKGITEFKLSFNAECIEYIGDLELITSRIKYSIYRNASPIRKLLKK